MNCKTVFDSSYYFWSYLRPLTHFLSASSIVLVSCPVRSQDTISAGETYELGLTATCEIYGYAYWAVTGEPAAPASYTFDPPTSVVNSDAPSAGSTTFRIRTTPDTTPGVYNLNFGTTFFNDQKRRDDTYLELGKSSSGRRPVFNYGNCRVDAPTRTLTIVSQAGVVDTPPEQCSSNTGSLGSPIIWLGDPVDVLSGSKQESITDYESADRKLSIVRSYNLSASRSDFGQTWSGVVPISGDIDPQSGILSLRMPNGFAMAFSPNYATQTWSYSSSYPRVIIPTLTANFPIPLDWAGYLETTPAEWTLTFPDGRSISLATSPLNSSSVIFPSRQIDPDGFATTYQHDYNFVLGLYQVNTITGMDGRVLGVNWQGSNISRITLPDGTFLRYNYNAPTGSVANRLAKVDRLAADETTILWSQGYYHESLQKLYAVTGVYDALGNRLNRDSYNAAGQVLSTALADGTEEYRFNYRTISNGTIQRDVTNSAGKVSRYVFTTPTNAAGAHLLSRVEEVSPSSPARSFTTTIGVGSDVTGETNSRGTRTQASYDARSRPSALTVAFGTTAARTESTVWHPILDRPIKRVLPGVTIDSAFDGIGRLTLRTEIDTTTQTVPYRTAGQTRTTTFTWTAFGKIETINGPKAFADGRDDTVTYTYGSQNNLLAETNGLGQTVSYSSYDANGRPGEMVDRAGTTTSFTYDAIGRLKTLVVRHPSDAAKDATTSFGYDLEGRLTSLALPDTAPMTLEYTPIGRLKAVVDGSGARIDYDYDVLGNRKEEKTSDLSGAVRQQITRTFDDLGRMLTETLGAGRTHRYAYDLNDNVTKLTNARSQATVAAFDPLDRLIRVTDPLTHKSQAVYDKQDNVTARVDGRNVRTTMVRNGFGEVIRETSPDRGVTVYRYDPAGDLIETTDGRGQTIAFDRDILGRLTAKRPTGQPAQNVTYTYDSVRTGSLSAIADASGTTTYGYDHRGNVTSKAVAIAGAFAASIGYAYDRADRIVQVTYPSGKIVDYARDGLGRVSGVTLKTNAASAPQTLALAMVYEPFGPLKSFTYGNGLRLAQDWGTDRRLYEKSVKTATGAVRWARGYRYDDDDNLEEITDLAATPTTSTLYAYDADSRLTRATGNFGTIKREDYFYDANDNRTKLEQRTDPVSVTPSNTAISAIAAGKNRLASVTDSSGVRQLSYDGRGNISGELRNLVPVLTTYDPYGRLASYSSAGFNAFAMLYSGSDERVQVTVGTTPRRFVHDESGRLIGEYGATGTVYAEHVWLMPDIEEGGWEPLALVGPSTKSWVHGDHLGTPVLITSAAGAQVNNFDALPFGTRWQALAASPTTAMAFPGQLIDVADRFYNRYRDYDPSLGRYLQADPIGLAGGDNLYGYVGGNPLGGIDPDGLQPYNPQRRFAPQSRIEFGVEVVEAETRYIANQNGISLPPRFERGMPKTLAAARLYQRGVINGINQARSRSQCPITGGVYGLFAGGIRQRIGRTSNTDVRFRQHARDPALGAFDANVLYRSNDYATLRGLEHYEYEHFRGAYDFIRPISPRNQSYDYYIGSAAGFIGARE
jgi:RHS repeat-associated protein